MNKPNKPKLNVIRGGKEARQQKIRDAILKAGLENTDEAWDRLLAEAKKDAQDHPKKEPPTLSVVKHPQD